jgi:uncharacterized protein YjhX (UPF0386 family)
LKPRVKTVDHVPRLRHQRSQITDVWPTSAAGYHHPDVELDVNVRHRNRHQKVVPGQLGRFPTIGIDSGHIPGTRPDQRY